MLFFLMLHDVVYPDTLEPIVSAGELLTLKDLRMRFDGDFMDNVVTHIVKAPSRPSALKIVATLATQP